MYTFQPPIRIQCAVFQSFIFLKSITFQYCLTIRENDDVYYCQGQARASWGIGGPSLTLGFAYLKGKFFVNKIHNSPCKQSTPKPAIKPGGGLPPAEDAMNSPG